MNKNLPLSGLKVLELGTHVAVPNATRWLADWGAEVIKVEGLGGEPWRSLGLSYNTSVADDENPIFTAQNGNKRFLAIDMKTKEGMEIFKELLAETDIFVSNVRIKSLKKMGIDYESLKETYPKMIYCHFTGYGYLGPDSAAPGFDLAAYWSRNGLLTDWSNEGDYPVKPVGGFGDATVSSAICSGILAAVIGRNTTGKGTFLSSSLQAAGIWYVSTGVISTQEMYGAQFPKSKKRPNSPIANVYRCKDGEWIYIVAAIYHAERTKVFTALGLDDLATNEKYATQETLAPYIEEVTEIINKKFEEKTSEEWEKLLTEADIVHARLRHMKDIVHDEQAWANGYLSEVEFTSGRKVVMPSNPVQFSDYDTSALRVTGRVGRDTEEILTEKGYSKERIEELLNKKCIK